MKVEHLLITGEKFHLERHQLLFQEFASQFQPINYLPIERWYQSKFLKNIARTIKRKLPNFKFAKGSDFGKNPQSFLEKSQEMSAKIETLPNPPDLIFHLYGMFSPFTDTATIPYVTYLDYNMSLARRNWLPWANFVTEQDFEQWIQYEQKSYQNAHHIFTKSAILKSSLIEDYRIHPDKITVVWSSGNYKEICQKEKKFGRKQILFNGSDFQRKGGDLLLSAFRKVKEKIPEAQLIIIGQTLPIQDTGIINQGYVSNAKQMEQLFLNSDLVISPALCDPCPRFIMEAMNYGVPCIVSNRDGMPEIVDNNRNGIVINELDPEILAHQIVDLLNNPNLLIQMSHQARLKIRNQLNWSVVAKKILDTIDNL